MELWFVLALGEVMNDPYLALGVEKTATADEIRKAYLRLAKKSHPDLNPGNKDAEERFKQISSANDLLSDNAKRKRFDDGEIDASGAERPRERYYKDFADGATNGHPYEDKSGYSDFGSAEDIFADFFKQHTRGNPNAKGADAHYKLDVEFLDAVNGATKRLTLPGGGTLDVVIPAGVEEGKMLRLRGKGAASAGSGLAGDALVEVSVKPHRFFVRLSDDIHLELPISLTEAVLGAQIKVPTPTGAVMLTIPKGSNSGSVMRLKGKGVQRNGIFGNEIVKLKVVLPSEPDQALEGFLASWPVPETYNPRRDM